MPNNLVDLPENQVLDHLNGVAQMPYQAGAVQIRLMTAHGGDGALGTEVSGGGYGRRDVTFGPASAGSATNTTVVRIDSMPAVTLRGFELWTKESTPRRLWAVEYASPGIAVADTQPLEYGVGQLSVGID